MIGTKLPRNDAGTPRDLAAATREMMWACTLAATRTTVASMSRGLAFWSEMLRSPAGPWTWPFVGPLAGPFALAAVCAARAPQDGPAAETAASEPAAGEAPAFASYRSSSGHAAAQVTQQR
jgi:hypothetical protein